MNKDKLHIMRRGIEKARKQLNRLVEKSLGEDLNSEALLEVSEQLDRLIKEYIDISHEQGANTDKA